MPEIPRALTDALQAVADQLPHALADRRYVRARRSLSLLQITLVDLLPVVSDIEVDLALDAEVARVKLAMEARRPAADVEAGGRHVGADDDVEAPEGRDEPEPPERDDDNDDGNDPQPAA